MSSGSAGTPPTTTDSSANMYKAYLESLPGINNATNAQLLPTARAQLNTNLATTPIQNAFNLQQLMQYGLPTAEVNQRITDSNALAGSRTQFNTLLGPGGITALAGSQLNRLTNPNYAKVADASANKTAEEINGFNLNGLSPGEQNSVERSLNQSNNATGNLGLSNRTNDVSNALNFGGAFNSKLGLLNNTLGTAASTGNMLQNNGFNSMAVAFGQPQGSSQSQFGSGAFGQTGATGQNNIASNLLGQQGSLVDTAYPLQAKSAFDNSTGNSYSKISEAFGNYGSGCCFIFMEAYEGMMPWWVRKCRDRYYKRNPRIARGYVRMAKWLVPLMQRHPVVRSLVWRTMVSPITWHGYSIVENDRRFQHKHIRKFWFTVWNFLGKKEDK